MSVKSLECTRAISHSTIVPKNSCCAISVMQVRIMLISVLQWGKNSLVEWKHRSGQSLGSCTACSMSYQVVAFWWLLFGIPEPHLWKFHDRILTPFSSLIFIHSRTLKLTVGKELSQGLTLHIDHKRHTCAERVPSLHTSSVWMLINMQFSTQRSFQNWKSSQILCHHSQQMTCRVIWKGLYWNIFSSFTPSRQILKSKCNIHFHCVGYSLVLWFLTPLPRILGNIYNYVFTCKKR